MEAETKSEATQIEMGAGDLALVVREDGSFELVLPSDRDKEPNDPQFLLYQFATTFEDERVQEVLASVFEEQSRQRETDSEES